MTNLNEILSAAESLPAADRAQLIAALWEKMSPNDWVGPSDSWLAEAKRRSEAFDRSELAGDSWDLVRERARRKAGLDD